MEYLFVCGAPRSGTTAMWRLLAGDERVVIGVERYGNLFFRSPLTVDLFTPSRFSTIESGDTFYSNLEEFNEYYKNLNSRFTRAKFVGDKIPLLYMHLDSLFENIPDAKVILLLRNIFDVAASYEARANNPNDRSWKRDKRTSSAIQDWRNSIRVINQHINDKRVLPIIYEDFFFSGDGLEKLYRFLGLEITDAVRQEYESLISRSMSLEAGRKRDLPINSVMEISLKAPFGAYREIVSRVRGSVRA